MADVNRGNRPLSPHLDVYKFEWTMIGSITHRITGVAMSVAAALIAWWLLAAATSPEMFATADALLTSWFGNLVLLGSLLALSYHILNGLRHLAWDAGYGLDLPTAAKSARGVMIGAVALTALVVALV
ncbi:MAG: succinate dehydrogenase, cytochrome b556 subunit [Rubrimonas sp.]|uniref:succinate dehydrogenase, cytochrome b556 subunit n=1 Tax=Rubrimonas sp. TaxID=2036015 RepID=UPI002FDEE9B1